MIPILLASTLSCSDAESLIERFTTRNVPQEQKVELIRIVKDSTEAGCWDAND